MLTRRRRACLVQTIIRPVRDERPALDFFRNVNWRGDRRWYHLEVNVHKFREAFDVTDFRLRNKIKFYGLVTAVCGLTKRKLGKSTLVLIGALQTLTSSNWCTVRLRLGALR